jgi:hypothetical protein
MRKLLIAVIAAPLLFSGCATQSTSGKEMMLAFSHALANCKGEVGCIAGVQAGLYSGAFRDPQQDTVVNVLAAALPWGRIILDGFSLYKSSSGGGSNGILVKGNNNQFIGFDKYAADRGASIYSPFSATAAPTMTQSWADLYNQENIRSQNQ